MKPRTRLTAKDEVLREHPDAFAYRSKTAHWSERWAISTGAGASNIGSGSRAADAWASAARNLRRKHG